ncbi:MULTISPECIES: DsbA family protein [Paenibacillus]|uniref:DsbA family protein n=1 Tax=Paenibacillus TaxID=44249 RepID=UPI000694BEA3|nr:MULTISPECIES: thioredoxin domain-containing protein [unclassified Paenibacillus]OMF26927.1 hypothetical protein BK132_18455 [Paenibacillus sp. FSL H8-0259]
MKKNTLLVTVVVVLAVFFSVMGAAKSSQRSELEKIPSLMDAVGQITLTPGDFKLDKQPSMGDPSAPVKVIEFIDYKCPSCKKWDAESFPKFKQEFIDTGKVQFFVINFPFLGPDSIEAAMAAESIFQQDSNKFWEFKVQLYSYQGKEKNVWATEKLLKKIVSENINGIDQKKFAADLENHTYLLNVKEDFKISAANGVYGTPSFIVNGTLVKTDDLSEKIAQMTK